jgi:hypothetical protein
MGMSAFVLAFVGLLDGKFGLPDKGQSSAVNNFRLKCRVCRVSVGVERPEETDYSITSETSVENAQPTRKCCGVHFGLHLDSGAPTFWRPGTVSL